MRTRFFTKYFNKIIVRVHSFCQSRTKGNSDRDKFMVIIFLLIDGHEIQMLQRFRCFEVRSEDGSNSVGHIGRRLSYINSFGPIEVSMRAGQYPKPIRWREMNIWTFQNGPIPK